MQPNLLIILADGLQADAVSADHPCPTPNIQAIGTRGVTFANAHTTCPTCSPARSSLMTGLLPHNHGVLDLEHVRDDDQCVLRREHPHFASRLQEAGYHTAYFGKWHVERTNQLAPFGWQHQQVKGAEHVRGLGRGDQGPAPYALDESLCGYLEGPEGYNRVLHWGVTDTPLTERYPGLTFADARQHLAELGDGRSPWCCCVSLAEPNEALVVGRDAWLAQQELVELPENFFDDMSQRPRLYARQQEIGRRLSREHWRAARACYFGRIAEIDTLVGELMERLRDAGQLDGTVVVFLSDHGRYVGAHGFDAHNCGPFEEIYRIPLVMAGPGVAAGRCDAPVSIADLCPTLCELGKAASINVADSQSLVPLLEDPAARPAQFETGYAEYHGTRFPLMQRVLWRDGWKLVFNGFDYDELYDLASDPHEQRNLARVPEHSGRVAAMMRDIWRWVRKTDDRTIGESHYFSMRFAAVGPEAMRR